MSTFFCCIEKINFPITEIRDININRLSKKRDERILEEMIEPKEKYSVKDIFDIAENLYE